jgi:hypothetical protein
VRANIPSPGLLVLHRKSEAEDQQLLCLFNFGDSAASFIFPDLAPDFKKLLDSKDAQWTENKNSISSDLPKELKPGEVIRVQSFQVVVYVA